MPRKMMTPVEINEFSERVIEMLKGMPVRCALDILRITENNLLYLSTVSKPEDDIQARQIDLEDLLEARPSSPSFKAFRAGGCLK